MSHTSYHPFSFHMSLPWKIFCSSLPFPHRNLNFPYYIIPILILFPLLRNSMLKTLLLSSSSSSFFSRRNKFSSLPRKFPYPFTQFPSLSWPFSSVFPRPIHVCKVLAMAERTTTSSSHSHKYNNRLATEHSPYLLQHAHNPVILSSLLFWDMGLMRLLIIQLSGV